MKEYEWKEKARDSFELKVKGKNIAILSCTLKEQNLWDIYGHKIGIFEYITAKSEEEAKEKAIDRIKEQCKLVI